MKIYVASSWRNNRQPEVVEFLRKQGHEVYDFKNPEPYTGFAWSEIDPNWENWTNQEYFRALSHPRAIQGFESDFNAMKWADACVLVMPCGRSAHTEAGWMQGMNKPTIVLIEDQAEPELMYKVFEHITDDLDNVNHHISVLETKAELKEQKALEDLTERNMNTISHFVEHFEEETGLNIPDKIVLSFFNG